jgi:hypothetical protein
MAFTAQAVCHEDREEACEMIDLDDLHSNAGMIKVLKAISKQSGGYWYLSTRLLWANYRPHVDFEKDELNARQHAWRLIREALSP